jgi:mono/diheme cytochrome c family protein
MAKTLPRTRRALVLSGVMAVVLLAVSCGRATEDEINQALGITPTATLSAEQVATETAVAAATRDARTAVAVAAAANPGGSPAAAEAVVAVGDVTRGRTQFTVRCALCHAPGGNGGNLLAAGGPGASADYDAWLPLIREGTGHPRPPGPFPTTVLSDAQLRDVIAFIRSQAGG